MWLGSQHLLRMAQGNRFREDLHDVGGCIQWDKVSGGGGNPGGVRRDEEEGKGNERAD